MNQHDLYQTALEIQSQDFRNANCIFAKTQRPRKSDIYSANSPFMISKRLFTHKRSDNEVKQVLHANCSLRLYTVVL